MPKPVQDIFDRIQEKKRQHKVIARQYQDALAGASEYQKIKEQMEKLRAQKVMHEKSIKEQATASFAKLDELKFAIAQDNQMLSDVALTTIMKGDPVDVRDDYSKYEPVFTVRFRKIK